MAGKKKKEVKSKGSEAVSGLGVSIPRLKRTILKVQVEGTSPLICHNFSDKSKKMMLALQTKTANKGREAKNPISDFVYSLYMINGNNPEKVLDELMSANVEIGDDVSNHFKGIPLGFPASGFKKAAVSSCRNVDGVPMTLARGAFFVKDEFVEIEYDKLIIREDAVRLNGKTSDLRYRGCLEGWRATLTVEINPNALTAEQVCNLIDMAGFSVGVGDWRPERDGSYGMFQLAD